jgi:hypothetical protein
MRQLAVGNFNEMEIREKMDFALILQNKGFTELALKQLEKAFDLAQKGDTIFWGWKLLKLPKISKRSISHAR